MSKIRVLIADDIEETRSLITRLLSIKEEAFEIVAQAANGQEVLDLIPKAKPDIVLMDINMPILNGLEAAEIIEDKYPEVMVIIMSVQSDHEYLKKAMFIGAKDYIIKPFSAEQLTTSIENTYNKYHDKALVRPTKVHEAKVVSFFSTKGGVGKSVLTSNYGVLLGKTENAQILIWDLDLQFGDQALLFDRQKGKTLSDLLEQSLSPTMADAIQYLEKITENVHLLCAPTSPEKAEEVTKEVILELLEVFRDHYDYIVLDLGVNYNDVTLSVLDLSQKIYFVTTPDLLSLKNTKLGLNVMKSLNYEPDKVNVLINKYSNAYTIKPQEIEELLHFKVGAFIHDESKDYIGAVNLGKPILTSPKYKGTALYKSLSKLEV